MLHQDVIGGITLEWRCPCAHLVENHPKRINIAARIFSMSLDALGRNIVHIFDRESQQRLRRIAAEADQFWLTERIFGADILLIEQNIAWSDCSMNDATLMCIVDSRGNRCDDTYNLVR